MAVGGVAFDPWVIPMLCLFVGVGWILFSDW